MQNMEFFFENVNMISNRRGVNCNAQQRNCITIYLLDEKKKACYKHGFIEQRWISSKKQTNIEENYDSSDGNFRCNF